ncbi:unnamed protein product [Peronospora destructor]|uniref:Uncharacterized protein n=1 Tax=Peronospora destructor TaxID=86335 RepID=A0AAV0V7Q6_9STRA|nr:unnamed protein product [Peronospora destructor]
MLLRRANSLALLLTGDGRFGALDGAGEKIISIGPLPLADAALRVHQGKSKLMKPVAAPVFKAFGEPPSSKTCRVTLGLSARFRNSWKKMRWK